MGSQFARRLARSVALGPPKWGASMVLNALDPLAVRRWRRRHPNHTLPIPPRALRARVGDPAVDAWVSGGHAVASELERILAARGRPVESFTSICDFGCGSGRVLIQLRRGEETRLHGMDVDADAIRWLTDHTDGIDARANPPHGPPPFPPRSFDLICSISIFTHLSEPSQRLWLAELAKLLRPGGLAVLTVHGEELRERWAAGDRPGIEERQRRQLRAAPPLEEAGFIFVPEARTAWNAWRYRGTEQEYGLAFWDPDALRAAWSEWFEVAELVPGSINWRQDAVILRPR